jgi:predicted phosphodiesterase
MRLAFISDIHSNLPALEAVWQRLIQYKPYAIYCLGDLVGYGTFPNEVIDLIRSYRIPTIAGNYDAALGRNSHDCGCAYRSEEEKIWGQDSIAYTSDALTPENRDFLRSLPYHVRLTYQEGSQNYDILLVHGSPRKINEYLYADRPEGSILRLLQNSACDIMLCGHTHKPYVRQIWDESARRFRYLINVGSVGKPKDGNPDSCFALVTISAWEEVFERGKLSVEFIRVPYDIEKIAKAIEACSRLPNSYADMLRGAY